MGCATVILVGVIGTGLAVRCPFCGLVCCIEIGRVFTHEFHAAHLSFVFHKPSTRLRQARARLARMLNAMQADGSTRLDKSYLNRVLALRTALP
jgi:hypothetical protein